MKRLLAIALLCAASLAPAQTVQPLLMPHVTFVNGAGFPCAGCSLYSYVAGSTTPLATYKNSTLTANTNPIILDASGGAYVWTAAGAYKFVLVGADGSTIWTVDNVNPSYLALAGGTLTGPLNGTTASFASISTATSNVSGTGTFGTLATGTYTQTSTGVYTGTAYNSKALILYDGADPSAMSTATQGTTAAFSAITAGANVPFGATTHQSNGIFSWIDNLSPNTNAVGAYSVAYCHANNSHCWGSNPLVAAKSGYTGQIIYGEEVDVNLGDASTTGKGINVIGAWSAQPTGAFPGIEIGKPLGGTGSGYNWNLGLQFDAGCCGTDAIYLGPVPNAGGSFSSMGIAFQNTAFTGIPMHIYEDASGGFTIKFVDATLINFPLDHTQRIPNVRLKDHPLSYISGNYADTTVIASGTCTFSGGSCALSYGYTYLAIPSCSVAPHYDGVAVGSTPPTVWIFSQSTTSVTIASSSASTSGTAEIVCQGQ